MPHVDIPWIGLAALVAMFVIPFLPNRFFEGPRTVRHWPRRHICGECDTVWSDDHACLSDMGQSPLKGELRRLTKRPDHLGLTTPSSLDQLSLPASTEE